MGDFINIFIYINKILSYISLYLIPIISIFGPLISSLLVLLYGRYLSRILNLIFILIHMFLSFLSIIYLFIYIAMSKYILRIFLYNWLNLQYLVIDITLYYDSLSITMLLLISIVSFLVHIYSIHYMRNDPHQIVFLAYLSLFTFFMFFLVIAENFIMFFLGWEGVGLCSYLLINFWSDRIQANKAALKAMIINRIGDVIFLLAIVIIFNFFGSLDFEIIFNLINILKIKNERIFYIFDIIAFLLFFGSIAKSSQLGLHSWLPDAMEGPTPVSALIHAATMVTAGVFLLLRCSYLLECSINVKPFIVFFGASTCLFAGIIGSFQIDVKKLIAYSTMSQLGYMYLGCGLSCYQEVFFHLWIHGFIKALLFLGIGIVIHNINDEQNMFKMGNFFQFFPLLFLLLFLSSLSLMALPYLSGYFSKHILLELLYFNTYCGYFGYLCGSFGSFFTAFYLMKLLLFVFCGPYNGSINMLKLLTSRQINFFSYFPLYILIIANICFGYFFYYIFIDLGSTFFSYSLYIDPINYYKIESENINFFYNLLPFFCTSFGICSSLIYFYYINYSKSYIKTFLIKTNSFSYFSFFLKICNGLFHIRRFLLSFSLLLVIFFKIIFSYSYKNFYTQIIMYLLSPFLFLLLLFKLLLKIFYLTIFYIFGDILEFLFISYNILFYYYYKYFKKKILTYKEKYYYYKQLLFFITFYYYDINFLIYILFCLIPCEYYRILLYYFFKYRQIIEKFIELIPSDFQSIIKMIFFEILIILFSYKNKKINEKTIEIQYFYPYNNDNFFIFIKIINITKLYNILVNNKILNNSFFFFLNQFFSKSMFFDKIINNFISLKLFIISWLVFFKTFDKGLLEFFGPIGISRLSIKIANYINNFQTGLLFDYICTMIFSLLFIVCLSYIFII